MTTVKIKFVGRGGGNQPLPFINDGSTTIVLPENQSRPFSHPMAKRILKLAPELYKKVTALGAPSRKVYRSAASGKFVSKEAAQKSPTMTVSDSV